MMRRRRFFLKSHAIDRMRERIPGLSEATYDEAITAGLHMLDNALPFGGSLGTDRMFMVSRGGCDFVFVAAPGDGEPGKARWIIKSCLTMAQARANIERQVAKANRISRRRKRERRREERERLT